MTRDYQQIGWDARVENDCRQLVRLAVREDLDRGCDLTTLSLVGEQQQGVADVMTRETGVAAGLAAVEVILDEMDVTLQWTASVDDGAVVEAGSRLGRLEGSARDLLTTERTLLNFLGRLCGVATLTRQFVDAVSEHPARIYDTRKTTPGWRRLEKYATRLGGAHNHRTGLFDAVLIKDNHLALAQSLEDPLSPAAAVRQARQRLEFLADTPESVIIEVEVDTLEQLSEVLKSTPEIVLLDNMTLEQLAQAVQLRDASAAGVQLEASGGITLQSVAAIAATGVDRISSGALTHSARVLDLGLDWRPLV